ncbi:DUF547 domain-containing protein [Tepidicaulis sp. LMO-SS28]|uniref:DUF547 domain-containing protein n=1 Tax=Tepidicaulis sp. LMO-SS28 TaxID=3447455 RepID=UPI003EDFABDE
MRAGLKGAAALFCLAVALLLAPFGAISGMRAAEGGWEVWAAHDPESGMRLDHSAFAAILAKYARPQESGPVLFDYAGLKAAPEDMAALGAYLEDMQAITVSRLNRDAQFSYWVNLYNALTVKVVTDHYPVESIRDVGISPGLFSRGPWGAKLLSIEGREVSLDDIEHRILRPLWQDARIHYVVNCASIGCPDLPLEPLEAAGLDARLDAAARAYIASARGARLESGKLIVSRIYDWYAEDFGDSDEAVIAHLMNYAEEDFKSALGRVSRISDYEYDWSLNDAARDGDERE